MKRCLLTLAALALTCFAAQAQTDYPATDEDNYYESEAPYDIESEEEYYEIEEPYEMDPDEYDLEFLLGRGNGLGLGIYGGCYYLTGYSDKTGSKRKSDFNDKFNIGIKYTLYDDEWFTFLVKYEQTSFWETYEHLRPISETIFSPGVELTVKMNPVSRLMLGWDMKFNGEADEYARRFSYFKIGLFRDIPLRGDAFISAGIQTGLGRGYVEESVSIRNYFRYNGYFTAGAWFQSSGENLKCRIKATPYDFFNHCAVQVDFYYRPSYSLFDRIYYMVQYGYGLEQQHQYLPIPQDLTPLHYIRIGLCLRPEFTL